MHTFFLTSLAMLAFAANSLFSRLALADDSISVEAFTLVRILSGAVTLSVLLAMKNGTKGFEVQWGLGVLSGLSLFVYAALFSLAYTQLSTGTGALILFGSVQITLLAVHLLRGHRFSWQEWLGVAITVIGFVWLVNPSASSVSLWAALCMMLSGVSWACFTILGKKSVSALPSTTKGFIVASAVALVTLPWFINVSDISMKGLAYAIASGAIASGMGYVIWYAALPKLSLLQASICQLSVPAIALVLGALFLQEVITQANVISMCLILGGIGLTLFYHHTSNNSK